MRILKALLPILALVVLAIYLQHQHVPATGSTPSAGNPAAPSQPATQRDSLPAFLPHQARTTLELIARGGPFPHAQDGVVFGNYEGLLPREPRGYYHEYTVETPGLDYRGARRLITGGDPPVIYYYTNDHYRSFRAFKVSQ